MQQKRCGRSRRDNAELLVHKCSLETHRSVMYHYCMVEWRLRDPGGFPLRICRPDGDAALFLGERGLRRHGFSPYSEKKVFRRPYQTWCFFSV